VARPIKQQLGTGLPETPAHHKCLGFFQLTGLVDAERLPIPDGTSYVIVQAERAPIRWRDDGVAPGNYEGMRLCIGTERRFDHNLEDLQFCREASGAVLNVSCYS
jgi:hypothetical protein